MSVDQMRDAITKVYDNPTWAYKVRRMADNQVIAIYRTMQKSGKFDKKPRATGVLRKGKNANYRQLSIFDFV